MHTNYRQTAYANTRASRIVIGIFSVSVLVLAYIYMYGTAFAAFNPEVNYQGKLTNSANVAVTDGAYHMRFKLYTGETGGTLLHTEDRSNVTGNRVTVSNGLFSAMIGSSSPITAIDWNQPLWLEVEVGGTASSTWETLSPRKRLGAVPAAFVADTLDGVNSTQFVRADTPSTIASTSASTLLTITQSGTGDILNLFDGATEVLTVLDGGNVGIGSSSPSAKLTVEGGVFVSSTITTTNVVATGTLTVSGLSSLQNASTTNLTIANRLYDGSNSAGQSGYVLQSTGTGVVWVATTTLGGASTFLSLTDTPSSFTANRIPFTNGAATALTDSANFVFTGSNLGIGSTTPSEELVVASANPAFIVDDNDAASTQLEFVASGGTAYIRAGVDTLDTAARFRVVRSGTTATNIANFDIYASTTFLNGALGIGTTTPQSEIVVHDASGDSIIAISGSNSANRGIQFNLLDGSPSWSFLMDTNEDLVLREFRSGNDDFRIQNTAGTDLIFLDTSAGTFGIGTSTPSSALTVSGSGLFTGNLQAANITATGTLNVSGLATFVNATFTNATSSMLGLTGVAINGVLYTNANGTVLSTTSLSDAMIADNITVANGNITGGSISGTLITTGTLTIGDGGDRIDINSSGWDVTNSVITGATWNGATIGTLYGGTGVTATPQDGELLIGDGLGYTLSTLTAGSGISITNGAGAITITNSSTTQWTTAGSDIYYSTGNIGVGSTSPSQRLSVLGNAFISGNATATNLSATGTLSVSGATVLSSTLTALGNSILQNASTSNLSANTFAAGQTGTTSVSAAGVLSTPTLSVSGTATLGITNITNASTTYSTTTFATIRKLFDAVGSAGTNGQILTSNGSTTVWASTSTLAYISSLNGLTAASQVFATTSNAGGFGFSSAGNTHTFNIPGASATTDRGLLTATDWTIFNNKISSTSLDTSAELAALIGDETGGAGVLVFNASPTFTGTATFANASSTNLSSGYLAVGQTGTTSISTTGALTTTALIVSGAATLQSTLGVTGLATLGGGASTTNFFGTNINGTTLAIGGVATTTINGAGTLFTRQISMGTTSSPWDLHIASTSPYLAITDTNAGINAKNWFITNNDGVFSLGTTTDNAYTSTSSLFAITNASTTFARALAVSSTGTSTFAGGLSSGPLQASSLRVTGGMYDSLNSSGTNGMVLQTTGAGAVWVATSTLGFGSGSVNTGAAGFLAYYPSAGTAVDDQTTLYLNTANTTFGIGSTSPHARLAIDSSSLGTTSAFLIGSSTRTLFEVDASGNVGIGTSSPTAALDIYRVYSGATINSAFDIYAISQTGNATTYGQRISVGQPNVGGGGASIGLDITADRGPATGVMAVTGLNVLARAGARSVGGTATSHYGGKVILNGSTAVSSASTNQNLYGLFGQVINTTAVGEVSDSYGVYGDAESVSVAYGLYGAASATTTAYGAFLSATDAVDNYALYSAAGKNYFAQNVGIGTSTPNWTLQVASTTPYFAITDTNAGTNLKHWIIGNNGGTFTIGTSTDTLSATTSLLTITNASTTFARALAVSSTGTSTFAGGLSTGPLQASSLRVTGGVYDSLNSSGTNGMVLQTTGAGVQWVATSTLGLGGGGSNYFTNSGANTYLSTGSKLGIGTSTPAWTLQVASATTPYLALTNTTGSANNKHWLLSNGGDGIFRIGQATDDLSATSTKLLIDSPAGNFYVGSQTGTSTGYGNNAIGQGALVVNNTGYDNNALGRSALNKNTSGFANNALGFDALNNNTSGSYNNAIGYQALVGNTTGTSNNALGWQALYNNNTGSSNAGFGQFALYYNTSGSNNIALGYQAGINTTGSSNIHIGDSVDAGNLTSSVGSIGIGSNIFFPSATANRQLNIGNILFGSLPATSTSFQLPTTGGIGIGSSSPMALLTIHGNQGDTRTNLFVIGSTSGSGVTTTLFSVANTGALTVSNSATSSFSGGLSTGALQASSLRVTGGVYDSNNTRGTNGMVLQTTGAGAVWVATSTLGLGGGGSNYFTNSGGNTYLSTGLRLGIGTSTPAWSLQVASATTPYLALTNMSGDVDAKHWLLSNSGDGIFRIGQATDDLAATSTKLLIDSTNNNFYVGSQVGTSTGSNNNALGFQALFSNTTGSNNNAFGFSALASNNIGQHNNAFGEFTLVNNTDGLYNNALGQNALFSNTTGYGNNAIGSGLQDNTTGNNNNTLGFALGANTTGSNNIGIGENAGDNTTIGWGNIALGTKTYFPTATGNQQLNIGNILYGSLPATSTSFQLPTTGGIGIGSSSPMALFTIHGNQGDTRSNLFVIGSTSGSGATTTLFSVANTGALTSNATASSTFASGINTTGLQTTWLRTTGALYDANNSAGASSSVLLSTGSGARWFATSSLGFLGTDAIDTCAEFAAIITGETGTCGSLVLSASPTFTGTATLANASTSNLSANYLAVGQTGTTTLTTNGYVLTNRLGIGTSTPYWTAQIASATTPYLALTNMSGASGAKHWLLSNTGDNIFRIGQATDALTGTSTEILIDSINRNFYVGTQVGTSTGSDNNVLGFQSFFSNTSGTSNNAFGNQALYFNTSGSNNNALGQSALRGSSTVGQSGSGNNAFGYQSLFKNTSGSFNTALGYRALYENSSGSDNLVIGRWVSTGVGITTGSDNILLGRGVRAGLSQTGSNQLNIGNLIFGTTLGTDAGMSTGKIGIGSSSPTARLSVHDTAGGADTSLVFVVASSSVAGTATTTLFSVSGSGTTTIANGVNIATGCFAVAGTCLSTSGSNYFTNSGASTYLTTGSNLGIGTSTPESKLHVYTSAAGTSISGANDIVIENASHSGLSILSGNTSTGNIYFGDADSGGSGNIIYNHANDSMAFGTVFGEGMRITSAGNVGIGTTTPATKLHVHELTSEPAAWFSNAVDSPTTLTLGNPNNLADDTGVYWRTTGLGISAIGAGGQFTWQDGSATRFMTLDSVTGNLGIGTTSPSARLSVLESSGAVRPIADFMNTSRDRKLEVVTDIAGDSISYTGINSREWLSSNPMALALQTGGTSRLYITSSGSVGIGTTSPWSLLSNSSTNRQDQVGTGGGTQALNWQGNSTGYVAGFENLGIGTAFHGVLIKTADETADANILNLVSGATSKFVVNGAGNVGIGTTSPTARLEVVENNSGNTPANAAQIIARNTNVSGYSGIQIDRSTAVRASELRFTTANTNDWTIGTMYNGGGSNDSFSVSTDGTLASSKLTVTQAGNVGIGTTTPATKLHTFVQSGANSFRVQSGSGSLDLSHDGTSAFLTNNVSGGGVYISSGGTGPVAYYTNAIERMRIDGSGNVGIGTTSPTAKLEIYQGDIQLDNGQGIMSRLLGTNTSVSLLRYSSTNSTLIGANSEIALGGSVFLQPASTGDIFATLDADTDLDVGAGKLYVRGDNGNIGAGSSTPNWQFTVASSTPYIALSDTNAGTNAKNWLIGNHNGVFTIGTSTDNYSATTSLLTITNASTTFARALAVSSTGTSTFQNGINIATGCYAVNGTCISAGGGSNYFTNSGAATYLTTGTNLGIGTSSPSTLLGMEKTAMSGSLIAGINQYFNFQNSVASAVQYGDTSYIVNAPTVANSLIGKIIRIEDSTALVNTVRGLEVQANRGTNTQGENTAISGFGRTFGVRGTTDGDAGSVFEPAGIYGETRGTIQGNALRGYSGTVTTADLMSLYHDTSAFTGTGLVMNFGNTTGSFNASTSKFLDFQKAGVSQFVVMNDGRVGIGTSTPNWGLQVASNTPYIALSDLDAGVNLKHWIIGNNGGSFSIGTSSDALTATSSAFTITSSGKVGFGTSSPFAKLSVISETTSNEQNPLFVFATTSNWQGTQGHRPILWGFATTTGDLNRERVAIGTTSVWGTGGGIRDSLTVDGRIYSTWVNYNCVAGSNLGVNLVADSVGGACGDFMFDMTTEGQFNSTAAQYPPRVRVRSGIATSLAANEGAYLRTNALIATATSSPVMEARIGIPPTARSNTTRLFIAGFTDITLSTTTYIGLPTNGVFFTASTTANWGMHIRRAGVTTFVGDTGVATTSDLNRMRIEVSSSSAIFLVNGAIVGDARPAGGMPGVVMAPMVGVNYAGVAGTANINDIDISYIQVWVDDPAGSFAQTDSGETIAMSDTEPSPQDISLNLVRNGDIAEFYQVATTSEFVPGMLVSNRGQRFGHVTRSQSLYDEAVMGAVSTEAQTMLGVSDSGLINVSLLGRAPVIVSLENGPIAQGDAIVASAISGIGMKATMPGQIVGRALEAVGTGSCDAALEEELEKTGIELPANVCVVRILSTIEPGFTMSVPMFADAATSTPSFATLAVELASSVYEQGAMFTKFVVGQVNAHIAYIGSLFAEEVHTKKLCVADAAGNETCITKDQLDALLISSAGVPVPPPTDGGNGSGGNTGGTGGGDGNAGGGTGGNTDTEAPIIAIVGGTTINITVGDTYADQGAVVTDNVDTSSAYTVSLDGGTHQDPSTLSLDTSAPGTHWIEYRAVDAAGNVGTATRNIAVEAAPAPEPPPSDPPPSEPPPSEPPPETPAP